MIINRYGLNFRGRGKVVYMYKVWLGPASTHLAEALAQYPDIVQLKSSLRFFPDGESCIKLEDKNISNADIIIIQNTCPPQDENLRHLFQMIDVLKFNQAKSITCIVPYLAYSRQDRRTHSGEPFSVEIVLKILDMLGVDTLVTFELHNANMRTNTRLNIVNISTDQLFIKWIQELDSEHTILVCPDQGSQPRIQKLADRSGLPFIALNKCKDRDGTTWYEQELEIEGDNKTAIIVDDLCSSGSTLIPLCQHLKKSGVARIRYGVTHFFANPAYLRDQINMDFEVYCTDTIPSEASTVSISSLIYSFITEKEGF